MGGNSHEPDLGDVLDELGEVRSQLDRVLIGLEEMKSEVKRLSEAVEQANDRE